MTATNRRDSVILVTPDDQIISLADKYEAHRKKELHRAISVFLFRERAGQLELLMQQRSAQKIVGAGQWANTVCGNVIPDETYEACARRRLQEELGIHYNAELRPVEKYHYQVQCNDEYGEHELAQLYVGAFDGAPSPNPAEASQTCWISFSAVVAACSTSDSPHGVRLQLDNHSLELAPWLVLYLQDASLVAKLQNNY